MVVCMMENGIKINGTEKVNVFMLIIKFTMESGYMELGKVEED